jgi:hypothetical protein
MRGGRILGPTRAYVPAQGASRERQPPSPIGIRPSAKSSSPTFRNGSRDTGLPKHSLSAMGCRRRGLVVAPARPTYRYIDPAQMKENANE